jgi:hypothetical protein
VNGTGAIGEADRQLLQSCGMMPATENPGALRDPGLWSETPLASSEQTDAHQQWFASADPQLTQACAALLPGLTQVGPLGRKCARQCGAVR